MAGGVINCRLNDNTPTEVKGQVALRKRRMTI